MVVMELYLSFLQSLQLEAEVEGPLTGSVKMVDLVVVVPKVLLVELELAVKVSPEVPALPLTG
jgi:hypothetical protein